MNNERVEVTKEEVGEQIWELFKGDSKKHRTRNYEKTYDGISQCFTLRNSKRYLITQNSKDNNDIKVERYIKNHH